jgi:hypothetical protein
MVVYQVRWNPFKGKHEVRGRSITQKQVQTYAGEGACADCDYQGAAEDFQPTDFGYTCPQCGSEATDVTPAQMGQIAQIGMGQAKPAGEPELIVSSFMGWHWDMRCDIEASPWAIKRQRISHGTVTLMLGDVNIPDSASSEDYGLEVLDALAKSGQALQGGSYTTTYGPNASEIDKQPTMFEAWLGPEDQALIEVEEGDTLAGVPMPKGKLSDFFKGQSCCVVGLNDGALIVGVFGGESHQCEVITSHWYMDSDTGYGRGMEDTAGVQRRFNQVDGQIYQALAMGATPSVMIDRSILKEDDGKYLYRPGQNIYVNLSMLPPNMRLQDSVWSPPPTGVSQQYIGYAGTLAGQYAQMSSLAVEFGETLLSIDNRTATGAQLTNGLANSLYGPMLMSKGESRVSIAEMLVRLICKYGSAGRYYPGKGAAKGRMVAGQDLRGKVVFELEQNSQLPTTPYTQQTDVRVALEALGGVQGLLMLKQGDPEMLYQLLKPFTGLKLESESEDEVSNLCLDRLEQIKQAFQSGVVDPNQLIEMIQPPVSMYEPKQKEKQTWWSNFLDLESGQQSPQPIRQAAEQMIVLHQNLETQRQMPQAMNQGLIQGVGAAAAQAPSAIGGAALQSQQPQPEQEDKTQELDHEAAMQDQEHEHELKLKDAESATQKQIAVIQGKNQLANTKLQGENQVKVEKSKPKPVVRKSA